MNLWGKRLNGILALAALFWLAGCSARSPATAGHNAGSKATRPAGNPPAVLSDALAAWAVPTAGGQRIVIFYDPQVWEWQPGDPPGQTTLNPARVSLVHRQLHGCRLSIAGEHEEALEGTSAESELHLGERFFHRRVLLPFEDRKVLVQYEPYGYRLDAPMEWETCARQAEETLATLSIFTESANKP